MLRTNWRAVGLGFVTTLVVGLFTGFVLPGVDEAVTFGGYLVTGVMGGLVAGYVAGGDTDNGLWHGGLAVIVGALVLLTLLLVVGLFFVPFFVAVGEYLTALVFLVILGTPGAVGGALGAWLKGRAGSTYEAEPVGE
ncbi:MAG: DUF5518 domain-containing protein [Halobacteriota archaeon]